MAVVANLWRWGLRLLASACLIPLLPAIVLMWFAKWVTPPHEELRSVEPLPSRPEYTAPRRREMRSTSERECPRCGCRFSAK